MCCTQFAENTGRKKCRQKSPSRHHRTTLAGYIFTTKARIDNQKKNLLSTNMSSICSHNMVNFGALTAEIGSTIWGTPANFNWFSFFPRLISAVGDWMFTILRHMVWPYYSARNARIASAVLATAIPSVRLSVRLSVCPSLAAIV